MRNCCDVIKHRTSKKISQSQIRDTHDSSGTTANVSKKKTEQKK